MSETSWNLKELQIHSFSLQESKSEVFWYEEEF